MSLSKKQSSKSLVKIFLFVLYVIPFALYGKPTVNILTWNGYLNIPGLSDFVENKCNVTLSYDNYFSNIQFLKLLKKHKGHYDIIIFSDTVYEAISKKLNLPTNDLYTLTENYQEDILKQYQKIKYHPNVVFFLHTLTGFLFNPNTISIHPEDDIQEIFVKAKDNKVALINDPLEIKLLFDRGLNNKNSIPFNAKNFKKLTKNAQIYFTDTEFAKMFSRPDFAFSYTWSGMGLDFMQMEPKLQFLVHNKLSYISTDLLAVLNNKTASNCVAKCLGGKEFLSLIQNASFYFSPYGNSDKITDKSFLDMHTSLFKNIKNLTWSRSQTPHDFHNLLLLWDNIKISYYEDQRNK